MFGFFITDHLSTIQGYRSGSLCLTKPLPGSRGSGVDWWGADALTNNGQRNSEPVR